jgi:Uma2 family endonuclease
MTEAAEMPAPSWLPDRPLTEEDLALLPDDGHRYEIVDGSLYVSPPPASLHQVFAGRIARILDDHIPETHLALEGVGIRLARDTVLIPDVSVVLADVALENVSLFTPADVLLAIEVVSPSSLRTDRVFKPALFAGAGIPAYWRVERGKDSIAVVVVHELSGDVYKLVAEVSGDGEVHIEAPFPITIRPSALLARR